MHLLLSVLGIYSFVLGFYRSFKALQSGKLGRIREHLAFWIVTTVYFTTEGTMALLFNWLPFYDHFHFLFLVFLLLPPHVGVDPIYVNCAKPLIDWMESDIDYIIDNWVPYVGQIVKDASRRAISSATESTIAFLSEKATQSQWAFLWPFLHLAKPPTYRSEVKYLSITD
ncbi:hypothetical protein H4R33_006610 [Dimargaris cristalligena]|nr:hypothetical protein H4R33_006610 [Dimargaris cristalligena]